MQGQGKEQGKKALTVGVAMFMRRLLAFRHSKCVAPNPFYVAQGRAKRDKAAMW